MAAYQGIVAPPVFVPMLQFMDAGSRLRAGRPTEALALIDVAIDLVGGVGFAGDDTPEMLVLHGDVLHATGATEAAVGGMEPARSRVRAGSRRGCPSCGR